METRNDLTKTENTDDITGGTDHGRAGRRWKTRGYPEEGTTEEKKGKQETNTTGRLKKEKKDLILSNILFSVMLSLQLHILHFPLDVLLPVVLF